MSNPNAGARIKYLRELNNYTREAFASEVDVSVRFLYEIEYGKKGFSSDVLARISNVLRVSADFILFGEENADASERIKKVLNRFDSRQINRALDVLQMILEFGGELS